MGMGGFQDQGMEMTGNNACASPSNDASTSDVEYRDLPESRMDATPIFGEDMAANKKSCDDFPWDDEVVDNQDDPPESADVKLKEGTHTSASLTFEESPAPLLSQIMGDVIPLKACKSFSVDPQGVATRKTRRRSELRDKISLLEKLIPVGSNLETSEMLEEASNYVKFLQAQVHVLECMPPCPSRPDSVEDQGLPRAANPMANDMISLPSTSIASSLSEASGISGSPNLNVNSSTQNTLSESLSAQQMLQILVTSPAIQRKLFREEKCVGKVQQYQMLAAATGSNQHLTATMLSEVDRGSRMP